MQPGEDANKYMDRDDIYSEKINKFYNYTVVSYIMSSTVKTKVNVKFGDDNIVETEMIAGIWDYPHVNTKGEVECNYYLGLHEPAKKTEYDDIIPAPTIISLNAAGSGDYMLRKIKERETQDNADNSFKRFYKKIFSLGRYAK
jgi:hypothetical protein